MKILRYHRLWSVLSGPLNSKPTFFPHILPVQRRPRYDEKGKRRDKGAIGANAGLQKRLYPTLFDVERVNCLVQNASYRFLELCFLLKQGAQFCKNREKVWPEIEKCTLKTLDGEFDAYMCGPGGAQSENVEKPLVLLLFFEGSREAWLNSPREKASEPDPQGGGRGRVNPPPCGLV